MTLNLPWEIGTNPDLDDNDEMLSRVDVWTWTDPDKNTETVKNIHDYMTSDI